jgi:hypothetical protein
LETIANYKQWKHCGKGVVMTPALFVEVFVLGLLNASVSAWFLLIAVTLSLMKLANMLGKKLFS